MTENFERIDPQEQNRILEACIAEFAEHGYAQASTNAIVRRAGIPKGTLFYYFGSKKDLYLYVLDYAIEQYVAAFNQLGGMLPADLFERLLARGRIRMRFSIEHPQIYRLFYNAFLSTPPKIQAELAARSAGYAERSQQLLFDGLDTSPFRPEVEVKQAVELVNLVLEGLFSRYAAELRRLPPEEALRFVEDLRPETWAYFELLKHGIYR
ncbi:MAG: TetR/AcrR family transcriptional regulator [Anaerolineales bacterium]|jgi:AcrR family transcriptional regulator